MKLNGHKILNNKPKLYLMVNLRLIGLNQGSLGALFGVDKTSIRHHLRKYQVPKPEHVYNLERIISEALPEPVPVTYKIVNGERINLGRSYKDYF